MLSRSERFVHRGIMVNVTRSLRKTCSFRIRDNEIYVGAPLLTPNLEIISALNHKWTYIEKHLKSPLKKVSFEWEDGETVYILGKPYALIRETASRGSMRIDGDKVIIAAPSKSAALNAYRRYATQLLDQLLDEFRMSLIGRTDDYYLSYRFYSSRWGCCFTKRKEVILNIWCVGMDREAIRYVFCHELAHLRVADHSRSFYRELERLLPGYKTGLKMTKSYTIK